MIPVRRSSLRVASAASLMLLAGCQTGEKLTLDATSRPAKEQVASYSLSVTDPVIEKDSLRHQEAERLVKAALAGNGFYESPDPAKADMTIRIDYGIGPGRLETAQLSRPVYRTDGRSHTESVLTGTTPDGREIYASVTIKDPPDLVYVGEQPFTSSETVYEKRLSLEARRTKAEAPGQAPDSVFIVDITSTGPSHDLRQTLPVLAAVALEHIGEETNGRKAIKLTDAEAIAFVKNPANAP